MPVATSESGILVRYIENFVFDWMTDSQKRDRIRNKMQQNMRGAVMSPRERWRKNPSLGANLGAALRDEDWQAVADYLDQLSDSSIVADWIVDALNRNDFYQCQSCNEWHSLDDSYWVDDVQERWCRSCAEDGTGYCGYCHETVTNVSLSSVDEGSQSCCDSCRDSGRHEIYEHSNGELYSEPEYDEEEEEEEGSSVNFYDYNQTHVRAIGSCSDKYHVSMELEMECEDKYGLADWLVGTYGRTTCHGKRDGSLSEDEGIEVVTGWGNFSDVAPIATAICNQAKKIGAKSHNASSCGLHIGVSRGNMTQSQIARIIVFWNRRENRAILECFCRRWNNGYASPDDARGTREFLANPSMPSSKYVLVNTLHSTHLEFRGFKGSLKASTITARLALCLAIVHYCESECRSYSALTSAKFLEWVRSDKCDAQLSKQILSYIAYRKYQGE